MFVLWCWKSEFGWALISFSIAEKLGSFCFSTKQKKNSALVNRFHVPMFLVVFFCWVCWQFLFLSLSRWSHCCTFVIHYFVSFSFWVRLNMNRHQMSPLNEFPSWSYTQYVLYKMMPIKLFSSFLFLLSNASVTHSYVTWSIWFISTAIRTDMKWLEMKNRRKKTQTHSRYHWYETTMIICCHVNDIIVITSAVSMILK